MITILPGDCLEVMKTLAADSIDACVTDPPYGIRFMGKAWDGKDIEDKIQQRRAIKSSDPGGERFNREGRRNAGENAGFRSIAAEAGKYNRSSAANRSFQEFSEAWAREMFRILKPGAYLVSFSSTRTYHRMACGIEDAGFEIRDQLAWAFGSGFPKSLNVGLGRGTALKPGWEPICLARKPLAGTVVDNLALHGTGALNIDSCRIPFADVSDEREAKEKNQHGKFESGPTNNQVFGKFEKPREDYDASGRWPANLAHDGSDEVVEEFPSTQSAGNHPSKRNGVGMFSGDGGGLNGNSGEELYTDGPGSASRFFFCAKASRAEREAGLSGFTTKKQEEGRADGKPGGDNPRNRGVHLRANFHPTVKPIALMRWLCRLVTPPGGTVIDCFMGSGSTGCAAAIEGLRFVGIEREPEYIPLAKGRIAESQGPLFSTV